MNKKLLAVFIVLILLFTSTFSSLLVFAEDDEETEVPEQIEETEDDTSNNRSAASMNGYRGLVAHWKFDGDLKDSTTFKNDGEAVGGKNGVTFVDSVNGKGVKLDGRSYISVKDSALYFGHKKVQSGNTGTELFS